MGAQRAVQAGGACMHGFVFACLTKEELGDFKKITRFLKVNMKNVSGLTEALPKILGISFILMGRG